MDATNKITITCKDWETRTEIAQAVADIMGINMLDIDDFVIRGSVMNGDLDEYSKDEFMKKYGQSTFLALENISYLAYVTTVEEPFVIALGNSGNEGNIDIFKKTISINVSNTGKSILSTISDYTVKNKKSIADTAANIVDIITADGRWRNRNNQ